MPRCCPATGAPRRSRRRSPQAKPRPGMTLMRIVRELDAGPVADAERVAIGRRSTPPRTSRRGLARAAVPLVAARACRVSPAGRARLSASRITQRRPSAGGWTRRMASWIFRRPPPVLAARINGLNPMAVASSIDAGRHPGEAGPGRRDRRRAAGRSREPSLGADATGSWSPPAPGILRLRRLQRPGGRMLDAPEFLRGLPRPRRHRRSPRGRCRRSGGRCALPALTRAPDTCRLFSTGPLGKSPARCLAGPPSAV